MKQSLLLFSLCILFINSSCTNYTEKKKDIVNTNSNIKNEAKRISFRMFDIIDSCEQKLISKKELDQTSKPLKQKFDSLYKALGNDTMEIFEYRTSLFKDLVDKEMKRKHKVGGDCPVLIEKSWITFNSIHDPEANITLKNSSGKTIDAIKVAIECYNNFGDPVNGGTFGSNNFMGIEQDKLRPGRKASYTWTMSLFDNTTKIKPSIYKVHFTDGSSWQQKDDENIFVK